jgi:pimeloyl-ACP methyl ester carboxylesterase
MTTSTETHSVDQAEVAQRRVQYLRGGSGAPVLVLHHSIGNPGWMPFYETLAQSFEVTVPDLPGYGQSERPEWARHPRDLAILFHQLLDKQGLDSLAIVGLGFGGWIAAEMATMHQSRISSLVIVGAPGVQPEDGEILDQMLVDYHEYVQAGFHDESKYTAEFGAEVGPELRELWDFSREMTARLSWKPYMYSRELPHLLQEVQTPTLLVWGDDDRIVPISAGHIYERSLPNARLVTVEASGHFVDFEQPERLAQLVTEHLGAG